MAAAVNGIEFHLDPGIVAPNHPLDTNTIGDGNLVCFGRAGKVIEACKILPGGARRQDSFKKLVSYQEVNDQRTIIRNINL